MNNLVAIERISLLGSLVCEVNSDLCDPKRRLPVLGITLGGFVFHFVSSIFDFPLLIKDPSRKQSITKNSSPLLYIIALRLSLSRTSPLSLSTNFSAAKGCQDGLAVSASRPLLPLVCRLVADRLFAWRQYHCFSRPESQFIEFC